MRQIAGLHLSTSAWSQLSREQFGQAEEACSEFTVNTDKCKNITAAGSKMPTSPGMEQRLGDSSPPHHSLCSWTLFRLFQSEFFTN